LVAADEVDAVDAFRFFFRSAVAEEDGAVAVSEAAVVVEEGSADSVAVAGSVVVAAAPAGEMTWRR
jgi:hypothetical protein